MYSFLYRCSDFFQTAIFFYALIVMLSYFIAAVISGREVLKYKKMSSQGGFDKILSSPFAPDISIIAPAYNEQATIVDNIRSLLSLHYHKLEVIVVNDGSKDNTLQLAINAYDLYPISYPYEQEIATKKVRAVYKSNNAAFNKLIVVDKENGGKADAINVGINISKSKLFACIDVDCIIEQDAFLKMAKPFMQSYGKPVIATGGIVWLINDAKISNGKLIELQAPRTWIARFQVAEYLRAFLIGRTFWAKMNGLMLISGAFGLFDRKIAVAAGGYNHKTVGEDMELVMRMHKYMREKKLPYKVAYVPEPLCWTEAPADYKILSSQRNRWTRGTIECLSMHKNMMFNFRYGVMGLLSYPYWVFTEWMAPLIEASGILFLLIMAMLNLVNWLWAISLVALVYTFAVALSIYSLYIQELAYQKYAKKKDILKLLAAILLEPLLYHPLATWWALKGNYQYFSGGAKGWGEMKRNGFNTAIIK
jgi:poly-beta-1,6-N-acetyl-D-glucosamine synthase